MKRVLAVSLLVLVGCTPRGALTYVPEASKVGSVEAVFIGTTREPEGSSFGSERSESLHFARFDVSIPPERDLGEINWPSRHAKPDPKKHFLTTESELFGDTADFRADLKRDLALHGNEVVIFVHGYNNNFSEGLYRVAQFAHDLDLPGTVVHYAWPSAASALGYVQDRDSTMFARDGLEELIDEVSDAGARRILLVAHSMGSNLAMEALRQTAIRGDQKTLDRLAGVILISPDIDVDLFRSQAHSVGRLPQPFVIVGSDRDRILRLSAQLTGQSERLGSLSDVNKVADLDVTFVDVSEFSSGAGHFTLGDSPALIALLDSVGAMEQAFEDDRAKRVGLIPGAVLTVQSATQIVLRPVAEIATDVAQ